MFPSIPGSASYHRSEPFCWSKSAKTAAVFSTCFATTTFLQNLALNGDCITFFPAKMRLVCARSMLFCEKNSYSQSFSSQNLKLFNIHYHVYQVPVIGSVYPNLLVITYRQANKQSNKRKNNSNKINTQSYKREILHPVQPLISEDAPHRLI